MTVAKIDLRPIISSVKNTVFAVCIMSACITMIIAPSSSSRGISEGIAYCLNILVPSLFPFMFIASFIVKSGLFRNFQKALSPLTKFLFYLPGCTAPAIFLGLIGGYPVGARGVKSLLENEEINSEQANRMMCFCVNAGPAFIMGVVGTVLLKNPFMGVLVFAVQVVTFLLLGILCGIKARINKQDFYSISDSSRHTHRKISEATISSCEEASRSMLGMCALVVIFSALISILRDFNILNFVSEIFIRFGIPKSESLTFLTSFLEITSGCAQAAKLHAPPVLIAFAIGYGGTCVHLQIASILKQTGFNYRKFCIFRFFNALISGILTHTTIGFLGKSTSVFSVLNQPVFISSASTPHGSVALIVLCLYFVCTVNKKR